MSSFHPNNWAPDILVPLYNFLIESKVQIPIFPDVVKRADKEQIYNDNNNKSKCCRETQLLTENKLTALSLQRGKATNCFQSLGFNQTHNLVWISLKTNGAAVRTFGRQCLCVCPWEGKGREGTMPQSASGRTVYGEMLRTLQPQETTAQSKTCKENRIYPQDNIFAQPV